MIELFVTASGIGNATAMAMYDVLRNSLTQTDAAASAISAKLEGENLVVFQQLRKEFNDLRKQRDRIAHGLWGTSPQAPEHLVLVDAKRWITWASKRPQFYAGAPVDGSNEPRPIQGPRLLGLETPVKGLPFEVEAWEEPDFFAFQSKARDLSDDLRNLSLVVLDFSPSITRALSQGLASLPERRKMTQEHMDHHQTYFSAYARRLQLERLQKQERRARPKPCPTEG